jgi:hypothetical protein
MNAATTEWIMHDAQEQATLRELHDLDVQSFGFQRRYSQLYPQQPSAGLPEYVSMGSNFTVHKQLRVSHLIHRNFFQ